MITAKHKILTYIGCEQCECSREDFERAVRATGAKVLRTISHRFQPQGLSILTLLAESHASLHTYPEYGFCYLDVFTCGDMNINIFEREMRTILKPSRAIEKTIDRSF
jgi:S-adenosylmethionine decarboxylase